MRARNLKPGFFKNEDLAELPPLTRILFAGLWGMADREGRLEDRPKRIKAEILPYDDCDVDAMLLELSTASTDGKPFIRRWSLNDRAFIEIPSFLEHQSPHYKEVPSEIPPYAGPSIIGLSSTDDSSIIGQSSVNPDHLNPESGLRTADCGILNPESPLRSVDGAGKPAPAPPVDNELLDELVYLAGDVHSTAAQWKPTKADRETFKALVARFPPEQIRDELAKFGAYAPQRDWKLFGKAFASWMGRVTPLPMPPPRVDAQEARIQKALLQWEFDGDDAAARGMCNPEEWPELERRHGRVDPFAGIDFGEDPAQPMGAQP